MTIRVRDLRLGQDLDDRVVHAGSDIVWTRDSTGFLYIEQDDNHRPFRVMLHRLGTRQGDDVEVFAEPDPAWFIGVSGSLNGRTAMIDVHGHDGSETRVVDLAEPTASPRLVAPRRSGAFLRRARRRRPVPDPHQQGRPRLQDRRGAAPRPWRSELARLVPHRDGCYLIDAVVLAGWLVLLAREDSRPRLIVMDLTSGGAPRRRLRRGDLRARLRDDLRVRLCPHPLRLFVDGAAGGDL